MLLVFRIITKCSSIFRWNSIIPSFLFLFTLIVYIHNLAPGIYGGDVGDFVSAVTVHGVPHPSGYPLMMVIGGLFNFLPIMTPAWRVGLTSAFASSLAVVFCYLLVVRFTKSRLIAAVTALFLAFFYLFWLYSEIAEVFSLNTFFVVALFYFAYAYYQTKKQKYFYLLSLLTGLSLTNHQTIVLLIPSLLILVLHKDIFSRWKQIGIGILLVILGFSVYLYVPFAASRNPPVNWDTVNSIHNFLRLVLRQDYGTFSSGANGLSFQTPMFQRLFSVRVFFEQLLPNITPIGIFVSCLGAIFLALKKQRLFLSILTGFLLSGPFFIAYTGFPLDNDFSIGVTERFFLMPFVLLLFCFPFGLLLLKQLFGKAMANIVPDKTRLAYYQIFFVMLFFLIPLLLFLKNFPKTDLSGVQIGNNIAKDLLEPLPKNAILFLSGDITIFNTAYLQYSLGVRPDVHAVNLAAPGSNLFYIAKHRQIIKEYHLARSDDFNGMLYLAKKYPIYSIIPLRVGTWIPDGLVYRLVSNKTKIPAESQFIDSYVKVWQTLHVPYPETIRSAANHNLTISVIPTYYAEAAEQVGMFLVSQYNDIDMAKRFFGQAVAIYPQGAEGYKGLGYIALTENKCNEAQRYFEKVEALSPSDTSSRVLLYTTYATCFHDMQRANVVASSFKQRYGMTINIGIQDLLKEDSQ